ncbi:nucleoporin NUP42 [Rhynchocyon petersi]
MTVCQFFLQGRCRFGERCWNEHPRAESGGRARQQSRQQSSGNVPLEFVTLLGPEEVEGGGRVGEGVQTAGTGSRRVGRPGPPVWVWVRVRVRVRVWVRRWRTGQVAARGRLVASASAARGHRFLSVHFSLFNVDRRQNDCFGLKALLVTDDKSGSRTGWSDSSSRSSSVIQPSSSSKSTPLGGSRDRSKSSSVSVESETSCQNGELELSHNSFTSLSSDEQKEEKKLLEGTVKDLEVWESSGQWMFSVYSPVKNKPNISGFTDISPEELRLQYHNFLTSNNLQSYLNTVQQLINQWRNRVNELKTLNASTKVTLLSDVKNQISQSAPAFGFGGRQNPAFTSAGFTSSNSSRDNPQNFSFKLSSETSSVFGSHPAFGAAPSTSSAITTSTSAFGFGKTEVTAASFSFKYPAASGFGSPGFSAFPAASAPGPAGPPAALGFASGTSGTGFGSSSSYSNTGFSKPTNNIFGNSNIATSLQVSNGSITADNVLFTPKDQLTAEELKQFQSRRFSLGKIPLKPPPVELLSI